MSTWKTGQGPSALDDTEVADDRTLALATPGLDAEKLDGFVRYQETVLSLAEPEPLGEGVRRLREEPASAGQARLADAEQTARAQAGTALAREIPRLAAMVADFCAKRWTLHELEARREKLPPPKTEDEVERAEKLESELKKLRAMEPFIRRHGREALSLLLGREDTLLALHGRQQRLLLGTASAGPGRS